MKAIELAVVVAVICAVNTCRAQSTTLLEQQKGSALYQACKANVHAADSDAPSVYDVEQGNRCIGYIQGVLDTLHFILRPPFCLADGATLGTISRVYVKFMDENPKYLDMHRTIGFVEAMKTTYPCSN